VPRPKFYPFEPEKKLTKKEELQAALVVLSQRIPDGYQVAIPLRIDASIKEITELFPNYSLPNQQELTAELEAWRVHIMQGQKYSDLCTNLMQEVFDEVSGRADDAHPPAPPK
jgi:hypothetical protein